MQVDEWFDGVMIVGGYWPVGRDGLVIVSESGAWFGGVRLMKWFAAENNDDGG